MKNDIAIFTPMANEEKYAKNFILELLTYKKYFKNFKIFIIIDKVSKDNTFNIVKNLAKKNKSLKLIWAPKNRSVVDAYTQGYKNCLKTNYKWILEIDAGGSHKPKNITNFLKYMNNEYECIFGSRFCNGGKMLNSNFTRFFFSKCGSLLSKIFFSMKISDTTSGYQMFQRKIVSKIIKNGLLSRDRFFQTEIKIYTRAKKIKEVPIQYICKTHSVSFYSVLESIYLLILIRCFKKNHL
ncbi:glycosyltransferase family 2 protein [Candidatus Pelagibacter sp.]|nr:glycosyltransferase family 2 protein [Candidatus Pelagibacter sp.]